MSGEIVPGTSSLNELQSSLDCFLEIVDVLGHDCTFGNTHPVGEPRLGPGSPYPVIGGGAVERDQISLFWVLNLSDGAHPLLDSLERSGLRFADVRRAGAALTAGDLLEELEI